MRTLVRTIAFLAAVLFFAAGCGDDGDNKVLPDVQESREDKLPGSFPEGFPLPEGSRVVASADLSGGVTLVLFDASAPKEGLREFFVNGLPGAGWALASCTAAPASPEPVSLIVAGKGNLQANVNAGYLPVDYPIAYDGPFAFSVQYWETPAPAATPKSVPEACLKPAEIPTPGPPVTQEPAQQGQPGAEGTQNG